MSAIANVGRRRTRCPRCDVPLAAVKHGESFLAGCAKCRGVWVDRAAFEKIAKQNSAPRKFGVAREARGSRASTQSNAKCPVCYYWMDAKTFENCPGLVVDVCRRHGTWFDADELATVLRAVKQPKGGEASLVNTSAAMTVRVAAAPLAIATAGATVAAVPPQKDRSTLGDAAEVVFELIELVPLPDIGDLASGLADIGGALFDGLSF